MKNAIKRTICLFFSVCMLSSLFCVNAVEARSSSYLHYYDAQLSTGANGKISVYVYVSGKTPCTQIGASSIYIYESSDGGKSFSLYATYRSTDYPSMMGTGTVYSKWPISFTGTIGNQYKATVYCRAANSSGEDTKSYNIGAVTAKR